MDLDKALRELYEEKKRIERAIARLEMRLASMSGMGQKSKRGRKGMSGEERLKVSARMTAYWAARRARAASDGRSESNDDSERVADGLAS